MSSTKSKIKFIVLIVIAVALYGLSFYLKSTRLQERHDQREHANPAPQAENSDWSLITEADKVNRSEKIIATQTQENIIDGSI